MKSVGMMLLAIGLASLAFGGGADPVAPEISPASGVGALTIVSGAVLVIRARRKK